MAINYFEKHPIIEYSVGKVAYPNYNIGTGVLSGKKPLDLSVSLRNIFVRTRVIQSLLSKRTLFYDYTWRDQDRPDTVAKLYYGSEKYFWMVLFSHEAFSWKGDYPLNQEDFIAYINDKYKNDTSLFSDVLPVPDVIAELKETTKHFEVDNLIVDQSQYIASTSTNKRLVSFYDYEFELNESKRHVKLVSRVHVNQIERELNELLRTS